MRYNVEMKTNRELGEKEGEACGIKKKKIEIIKRLNFLNTPIEKIAEIVELSIEDVKKIIG